IDLGDAQDVGYSAQSCRSDGRGAQPGQGPARLMGSVGTNSARRIACGFGLSVTLLAAAGCGHHKNAAPLPPVATAPSRYPPASNPETTTEARAPPPPTTGTGRIPITPVPIGGVSAEDKDFVLTHRPLFSQEGSATW